VERGVFGNEGKRVSRRRQAAVGKQPCFSRGRPEESGERAVHRGSWQFPYSAGPGRKVAMVLAGDAPPGEQWGMEGRAVFFAKRPVRSPASATCDSKLRRSFREVMSAARTRRGNVAGVGPRREAFDE